MSRVQIDPELMVRRQSRASPSNPRSSLRSEADVTMATRRRSRYDVTSTSSEWSTSDVAMTASSRAPRPSIASWKMGRTALEVTRRLSVSGPMFDQLRGLLDFRSRQGGEAEYENTYQMEPSTDECFIPAEARRIAQSVLEFRLQDVEYTPRKSAELTRILADSIKQKLKDLGAERYKLVVNVIIVPKGAHGLQIASRGLWNTDTDKCACVAFQNATLSAVAIIHALYFE